MGTAERHRDGIVAEPSTTAPRLGDDVSEVRGPAACRWSRRSLFAALDPVRGVRHERLPAEPGRDTDRSEQVASLSAATLSKQPPTS